MGALRSAVDAPANAGDAVINGALRYGVTFIADSRRTMPLDYRKRKHAVTDDPVLPIPRKYPVQRCGNNGVIRYKDARCGSCQKIRYCSRHISNYANKMSVRRKQSIFYHLPIKWVRYM